MKDVAAENVLKLMIRLRTILAQGLAELVVRFRVSYIPLVFSYNPPPDSHDTFWSNFVMPRPSLSPAMNLLQVKGTAPEFAPFLFEPFSERNQLFKDFVETKMRPHLISVKSSMSIAGGVKSDNANVARLAQAVTYLAQDVREMKSLTFAQGYHYGQAVLQQDVQGHQASLGMSPIPLPESPMLVCPPPQVWQQQLGPLPQPLPWPQPQPLPQQQEWQQQQHLLWHQQQQLGPQPQPWQQHPQLLPLPQQQLCGPQQLWPQQLLGPQPQLWSQPQLWPQPQPQPQLPAQPQPPPPPPSQAGPSWEARPLSRAAHSAAVSSAKRREPPLSRRRVLSMQAGAGAPLHRPVVLQPPLLQQPLSYLPLQAPFFQPMPHLNVAPQQLFSQKICARLMPGKVRRDLNVFV